MMDAHTLFQSEVVVVTAAEQSKMWVWVDWATKGLVSALLAGSLAFARWGINTEQRVHDLEGEHKTMGERITALESKQDGYQQIRTDLAVMQSKQEDANKKMERIEELLLQLSRRGP